MSVTGGINSSVQVAVIITAREEPAEYVQRTVQSIIAHTPETVLGEIIVIDDASTDRVNY